MNTFLFVELPCKRNMAMSYRFTYCPFAFVSSISWYTTLYIFVKTHLLLVKSLSENSEGCCFRAKSWMASGADHRPRRGRIPFMGLRPRSNEGIRLFARKPSGRQVFWLWAALARSSQPAEGMRWGPLRLGARRLVHIQNPSPQYLSQFSGSH